MALIHIPNDAVGSIVTGVIGSTIVKMKPSQQQLATRVCGAIWLLSTCEVVRGARGVNTKLEVVVGLQCAIMRVGRLRHAFASPCKENFRIRSRLLSDNFQFLR